MFRRVALLTASHEDWSFSCGSFLVLNARRVLLLQLARRSCLRTQYHWYQGRQEGQPASRFYYEILECIANVEKCIDAKLPAEEVHLQGSYGGN